MIGYDIHTGVQLNNPPNNIVLSTKCRKYSAI